MPKKNRPKRKESPKKAVFNRLKSNCYLYTSVRAALIFVLAETLSTALALVLPDGGADFRVGALEGLVEISIALMYHNNTCIFSVWSSNVQ